jgi:hypothetical protein
VHKAYILELATTYLANEVSMLDKRLKMLKKLARI